jgi:hypothetical protein
MTLSPQQIDELHDLIGALCNGEIDAERFARLQSMLSGSAEAQRVYVRCLDIHCALRRLTTDRATTGPAEDRPKQSESSPSVDAGALLDHCGDSPRDAAVGAAPLVDAAAVAPRSVPRFVFGGVLIVYEVTAALMLVGVLVAWNWNAGSQDGGKPTSDANLLANARRAASETVLSGRITATKDCRWVNPAIANAEVAAGTFAIQAGLLELTTHAGTIILLEGPVIFVADSFHGGNLVFGKMTIRTPRTADPRTDGVRRNNATGGAIASSGSPADRDSFGLLPFTLRTPIAAMTGGRESEFGVVVDRHGVVGAHVFHGCVDLRSARDSGRAGIVLRENGSMRIEQSMVWTATVIRDRTVPDMFARDITRARTKAFDSAVWAQQGNAASSVHLVAAGPGDGLSLQPAVTQATDVPANSSDSSATQWKTRYTYCVTFEAKADPCKPHSLTARMHYVARQYVSALRINGKSFPVPSCRDGGNGKAVKQFGEFSITDGLIDGTNRLEIDVDNVSPSLRNGRDFFDVRINVQESLVLPDVKDGWRDRAGGSNRQHGRAGKAPDAKKEKKERKELPPRPVA